MNEKILNKGVCKHKKQCMHLTMDTIIHDRTHMHIRNDALSVESVISMNKFTWMDYVT